MYSCPDGRLVRRCVVGFLTLLALLVVAGTVPGAVAAIDEVEPNDDRANATNITSGTTITGDVNERNDVDVFAIQATAGETINVTADIGAGGATDVWVQTSDGNTLESTGGTNRSVVLGGSATYTGTYYVYVAEGGFDNEGASYTVTVRTYETDDFEPNQDRENATQISPNATVDGVISLNDVDWFQFNATRGETINATADVGPRGVTGVDIVDRNGNGITRRGNSNTTLRIGTTARYNGTYYVSTYVGGFTNQGDDYTLNVSTYETDSFELNNDRENATRVSANGEVSGTVTRGDIDWFQFNATRGQAINATATLGQRGSTNIDIVDRNGEVITRANGGSNKTTATGTIAEYTGTYYVSAFICCFDDRGSDYLLNLSTTDTDSFEPNQDRANATALSPPVSRSATISQNDVDWFTFNATEGEPITLTADIGTGGRNVVELRDEEGEVLQSQDGTNTTVTVGQTANYTGQYYVRVARGGSAEQGTDYTLGIRTSPTGAFEPNENRAAAASLSPNVSITNTTVSIGDTDWYSFNASAGETINITSDIKTGGTNEIQLRDDSENVISSATASGETVSVGTTATYSGTYYLRVGKGGSAESGADYTLDLRTYTTDGFEPNERQGEATELTPNATRAGQISIGDTDWFEIEAPSGETINVTATVGAGGTNDVILADEDGETITSETASDQTVSIGTTARDSGTYYIQVVRGGFAEQGTDYTLDVRTYDTDGFEPNEVRANAVELSPNATRDATVSIGDADWFTFDAERGETINLTTAIGDSGTNEVELRNETGTVIASTDGSDETVTTGTTATYSGTYYVRVTRGGFAPQGADYTLDVRTYDTDGFEPNEVRANAVSLSPNATRDGTISVGDEDWFALDAERGETLNVTTDVAAGRETRVRLRDNEGGFLTQNSGADQQFTIGDTATETGTYYVQVTGDGTAGRGEDYTLDVRTYRTDPFEPNEDRGNASRYTPNVTLERTVSVGDTDWYAFDAGRGETVNVTTTVGASGTNDIRLFDGTTRVDSETASDQTVNVGTTAIADGTYYVRVTNSIESGAPYSIAIRTYRTDAFEPNENPGNTTRLYENPFQPTQAQISIGDDDWFAHDFAAGQTVRVTAVSTTPDVELDRVIVPPNASRDQPSQDIVPDGQTTLSYTTKESGTHKIGIGTERGPQGHYNVTIDVPGETLGLPNDRFEVGNPPVGNNDRANATNIRNVFYPRLGMVDDDRDYFEFDLRGSETLVVNTTFDHGKNDIALELLDIDGNEIRTADTATDNESLVFEPPRTDRYYLKVTGEADAQARYGLRTRILNPVNVTLEPTQSRLAPGDNATVDVVVRNASSLGVGSYDLAVTSSNVSAVSLTDGMVRDGNGSVSVADGRVTFDATNLTVPRAAEDDSIVVGNVTLSAASLGDATLDVSVTEIREPEGLAYPIGRTAGTAISVEEPVVDGERDGDIDYATIRAGLDNTGSGERLVVQPGNYSEALTIRSDVQLVAPFGATLTGTGTPAAESSAGIEIVDGAVPRVEGFTVTGFQTGIDATNASAAWTVRNTTLQGNSAGIVAVNASGTWEIHRSILLGNGLPAIDATNATVEGDATGNWFGSGGVTNETCVGNVDCSGSLSSRPAMPTPTPTAVPATPTPTPETGGSTPTTTPKPATPAATPTPSGGPTGTDAATEADATETPGESGPGMGLLAGLSAVLAVAYLVTRRQE